MPKEATGELRRLADGFAARITIEGRARKDFVLTTCATDAEAEQRCKALASMASRLRRAGQASEIEQLMAMGAKARAGRPWEAVCAAVDALCAGQTRDKQGPTIPTFAAFAKEWTDGTLAKKHPDHVPVKDSADTDELLFRKYINPVIGDLRLDEVRLEDADHVMAGLPGRLSSSSRRHVGQAIRRVLNLAVYPARHIRENPIPRGWLPRAKNALAFTCLRPTEDAALMAADDTDVALVRRLFFGVLAREGMRREEAAGLRWRDLDLERGVVRLDQNKTDDPRAWALDAGVARALKMWKERYQPDADADDSVFSEPHCGRALVTEHLAEGLRSDLTRAGVTRADLFERTIARRPLRVHDLRATFVTVSLANGKTETWVSDRTGHRSSVMIHRYRRQARTWSELGLGELAPLDGAIAELAPTAVVETAPITPLLPHVLASRGKTPLTTSDCNSYSRAE
jgi:integrase